jgi:hypothetical protein
MDSLAEVGELTVNGVPYGGERPSTGPRAALSEFLDGVLDIEIEQADPQSVSNLLSKWAGVSVSFTSSEREIAVDARGITGRELLDLLARWGEVEVAGIAWR